ncbi:hypothetical protein ACPXCE_23785 [Streptomyces sp. DT24]|uniref:hypothetical protein n=1 Tax=Streptomyces sp. DT24 TaxID=3416520 RepID=UPI003CFADA20
MMWNNRADVTAGPVTIPAAQWTTGGLYDDITRAAGPGRWTAPIATSSAPSQPRPARGTSCAGQLRARRPSAMPTGQPERSVCDTKSLQVSEDSHVKEVSIG